MTQNRLLFPWKRGSRGRAGALTTCSRQFCYASLVRVVGGLDEVGRRENRGVFRGKDVCYATAQYAFGYLLRLNVVGFLKNLVSNFFEPFLLVPSGADKLQLARGKCECVALIRPGWDPLSISNRRSCFFFFHEPQTGCSIRILTPHIFSVLL